MQAIRKNESADTSHPFLKNGGELGELTRNFDWSTTAIGTPDMWPRSLQTTVAMILASKFPMFLWWGNDLLQFYNDAYRPSLGNDGKHPLALGQKGVECWQETWPVIYPLIQQVLTTGEATWSEDQLIPIYRNGTMEDVYWTFGYSPILGDSHKIEGILVVCNETTDRVKNLERLKKSNDELEFAIEATELGIWDLNPVTNKFKSNARLKSWFGLPSEDETDLPVALSVIVEKDRQRVTDAIMYALQFSSGGMYDIEYTIVSPVTSTERVVKAKGRTWFNEAKTAYRFNGTLQDITQQVIARQKVEKAVQERTQELAEANRKLQKSNDDLAQFAYIASHDLQEPLRKIITFSQMLESSLKNTDESSKSYLSKIHASSARMRTLIRDVLDYSKLSKEETVFQRVDLNEVIEGIKTDFELLIEQKQATISISELPFVGAITSQMSQLFGNLVSNALKFSRPDILPVITITSTVLSESEIDKLPTPLKNTVYYNIEVRDNGIGFDEAYAEQIFNIFQRLHGRNEYAGTGIGLAMCKKIVLNHHGNILASTNNTGSGAVFNVILPEMQ